MKILLKMKILKTVLFLILAASCTKKKTAVCHAAGCLEVSTRDTGWIFINASRSGDIDHVSKAISEKINVRNEKDGYGKTALHWAAEEGRREVVALLLRSGAQVDATDKDGQTPLHLAVEKGQEEIVKMMVAQGNAEELTRAIQPDRLHLSPLYSAVEQGSFELVKSLLYGSAVKNNSMVAANGRDDSIAQEAVRDREAVVEDLRDQEGKTLLHVAAESGNFKIVKLLVGFMATAAEISEREDRNYLMKEVDYVNVKAGDDATAADLAKRQGHSAIVTYLKKIQKPWLLGLRARVRSLKGCNCGICLCCCGGGQTSGGCTFDAPTFDANKEAVISAYRKKWKEKKRPWS